MKRQHWPSRADDAEENSRPAKVSRTREEEQLTAGDFDLNATPRGFDLNAPVPEEEYGHGSDWMAVEPKERANEVSPPASDDNVQQKERERSTAMFKQPLEPAASLGIDEDLDLYSIWNAWSQEDSERLDHILASLCEEIGKHPFSPPRYQYLTCFYLSKKLPGAFSLPRTYKVLLTFLNPSGPGSLTKKQNVLPVFACRLLFRAFSEEPEWPLDFIKIYLEDAVSSRYWVDNEFCKEFVVNVVTAFRDDDQDISLGSDDVQGYSADVLSTSMLKSDSSSTNQQGTIVVRNRYPKDDIRRKARMEYLQALNQLLKVPSIKDSPRPLLRFFMLGVCYEEARVLASSMLEIWLNNPVHFRAAKALLDCIIHYTHGTTVNDFDTVSNLIALRLSSQGAAQMKTSLSNVYTDIVFQLVQRRTEYSSLALKTFLTAEVNLKASQITKGILAVLKALPDSLSPEREFAVAIKELAVNEYGARLQDAVGRLTKQLSREISPFLLARALLEPWPSIQEQHESARQAWLKEIIALVCHLLIQAGAPLASDESFILAISSTAELSKDKKSELQAFSMKVITFQVEALTWCTDVLNAYLPRMDSNQFSASVRKLLFLEPLQDYSLSSSSGDIELNSFQIVAFSMHASEEILARVILMGISNQFPMLQGDALCIIESLVWRAASSNKHKLETLFADNNQLPAAIMKLSSFNFPGTRQPLPQVMLRDIYWRSCLVILPIAVYNPSTIGKNVWENIPAIRCLLECLVTENTALRQDESTSLEEAEAMQRDITAEEAIEAFLAEEPESNDGAKGASSWSVNERWKGNVMLVNHSSHVRKPPKYVLEELDQIDKMYHLGHTLRAWKNPNFLGDTVSSQEFRHAWTWVKKVMAKEPEIVGVLPCAWQCELLYMHERSKIRGQDMSPWMQELCGNIYEMIAKENSSTENEVTAVVKFLAGKLMSQNCAVRSCARSCFSGILGCGNSSGSRSAMDTDTPDRDVRPFHHEDDCSWLEAIEKLQTASIIFKLLAPAIREALLYETSMRVICSYLLFLKKQESSLSFAYSIARLIMHRKILASFLLSMPSKDTFLVASDKEEPLPVTELVLESFSKALHICTQAVSSEWERVDSPVLKLVSPQYVGGRNNIATVSVNIPGVVVEAMVEVLGFVGSSGNETYKNNASYCHILQFLFPGCTDRVQKNDDDLMVAFIELESGERSRVLSKEQANNLVRTRDSRLLKAGFSILGLDAKLKLLKELGLSTEAKTYILEELEAASDASLQNFLFPLSNWQHLHLRSCFATLTESEESHFASILCNWKGDSSQVAPLQKHQSVPVRSKHQMRSILHEKSCEHLVKSTVQGLLYKMDKADVGLGSAEIEPDIVQEYFPFRILLQKAALGVDDMILECVHNTLDLINVNGGDVHLKAYSLVLPVFALLCEASLRGSNNSNLLMKILRRIKSGIKQELYGALIFAAVHKRIELLEKELAVKLKYTSDVLHVDAGRAYAVSYEGISDFVPLEQSLRGFLHLRLVEYWKGGRTSSDDQPFVSLLQGVMSSFRSQQLQNVAVPNYEIERAGRNGLLVGFLSFLDPDVVYKDQYLPLVCTFVESDFRLEKGNELLFTGLLLQYVIQKCRQQSVTGLQHDVWAKISKGLSGNRFEQVNKLRETFNEKLFLAAGVILEFLSASWDNDSCKNVGSCVSIMRINHLALGALVQDPITNLGSSSSARALTNLAVISCAVPENLRGTVNWNDHVSMALKSVIRAASGRHVMRAMIQQLVSMARNNEDEVVISKKPHVPDVMTDGLIQRAAAGLLCGLYMAYPVTVGNILLSVTGSSTLLSCFWMALSTSQTSSLHSIVRGALESVFSSRSNMGAYGLCYYLARKHPAVLIPHIPTLRLLLQEFVMPMKRGNPELWASNANLLVFTIELLDALRPCLLYDGGCSSTLTTQRSSGDDLELLLIFYFQILEDLDTSDQPFGKFIAQLADFLCHCLAAGGRLAKFINSHKQILQPAFQKFGKTKKISHLLHLLDQGSSLWSTSTVFDDLDETAVDQIEKVKSLLSRFLSFQKTESLQESWDIMGLGDYKVDDESGFNLLSTLTDLERASAYLPGILANMEDSLVGLLKMDDLDISERAYVLFRRFLQHNSSESAGTVAHAIIQQVTTPKTAQVETAARHVGKLLYYCEELQESILMELFRGGKTVSGSLHQILSEALSMSRNNVIL